VGDALGLGARQIDLVHGRNQLQPCVDREVGVRDRLRLDSLCRIDDQQRPLAGGERPGDLVGEVDVAGSVDQVELVSAPVPSRVQDSHGLGLDRDATLPLELHRVEHLASHLRGIDGVCELEDAVGQRRLAVVDVSDDREVANLIHSWPAQG
jgi:hypothetical protein